MSAPRVEIYRDVNRQWRFRIVGANGEILAQGESYVRRIDAVTASYKVTGGVAVTHIEPDPSNDDEHPDPEDPAA